LNRRADTLVCPRSMPIDGLKSLGFLFRAHPLNGFAVAPALFLGYRFSSSDTVQAGMERNRAKIVPLPGLLAT
jgi:hypothetical protein